MAIDKNLIVDNDVGSYNFQTTKRINIDGNGRLYIVYQNNTQVCKLAYSDDDGSNWVIDDSSPIGPIGTWLRNPSLWTDSADNVHITGTNPGLTDSPKYNKFDGNSWSGIEHVDSGNVSSISQICTISDNQQYCVYRYAPAGSYTRISANKRNGSWGTKVDLSLDSGWVAESLSACMDWNNNIHVVWQLKQVASGNDYKIQTAYWNGTSWSSITTLDTYDDSGGKPVIRLVGSTLIALWSRDGLGVNTSNKQLRCSMSTVIGNWGDAETITDESGNHWDYDISGGYGSNIIIVYNKVGADLNNPTILNLAWRYYDEIWSDEILLTEEAGNQEKVSIINNGVTVHLMWHDTSNSDIYHGSFDSTPNFPKEIYDYVDTIAADVDVTLSLDPQVVIPEVGGKGDMIHLADDDSEERVGFSSDFNFYITIRFDLLNEADAGTLLDIWADSSKANGRINSWKFVHPDGHTYVVRFDTDLTRMMSPTYYTIKNIRLKILGRIADS